MTDSQTPTYRSHTTPDTPKSRYHEPPGDSIEIREDVDGEDGVFEIRMPIATTGEVRNQNDDPLTRDELEGMAQQIGEGVVSVFPDHGKTDIGGPSRYSIAEKGGEWEGAEVVGAQDANSDEAELVATARLMDPDSLPDIPVRGMLGSIKELTKRDMSIPASIGWDTNENAPGGNDLMEASMVGIGADPRTVSDGAEAATVARAAIEAGADPDRLVATVRAAVSDERPLGPPEDPDRFETFEECVASLAEDGDLTEEEAERICGAWEEAKDQDMTDDDTGDEAGTTDEEQDASDEEAETTEREEAPAWANDLRDLLEDIHEAVREDDDEDEEEDDEEDQETDEDDDEEDEEDDEQSTNSEESETDDEQSVDEETAERIADLEAELEQVRNGELDIEDPGDADTDEEQDAESDADSEDGDPLEKYDLAPN